MQGPKEGHLWGDLRYDKFVAWCEKSSKSLNKVQPTLCRRASVSVVQWMNDEMSWLRGLLGKMNQHRGTTFF